MPHTAYSQPANASITLILNTPPQLPERVNDWERLNALFSVTVTNTGGTPLQRLRIAATVTNLDNNATLFRTKNDLTRPFTAPARIPTTLTAPQIFPANSIEYDASLQTALTRTNTLPEGAYRLCVRVIDERGATLGMEQCRTFNVIIPDPPSLISPANGDSVRRAAPSVPLLPQFQWTPVFARFGQQSRYKIRIVPIFEGQQPRQALEGNPALFEKIVMTSSYQWLPSDAQFSNYANAKGFAWQVQAVEGDVVAAARAIGRNEGKSEIFTFALGQQGSRTSPVAVGGDNRKEKRISPFDNSPKGNGLIGRNTPIPMSMISGAVKWSYRTAALSGGDLAGTSSVSPSAVVSTGETVSVKQGNLIGSNPNSKDILAVASNQQYPLPKLTVKVIATVSNDDERSAGNNSGGILSKLKQQEILLGTATTDANGAFALEFVNPIFAKQGAYIGDTVVMVTTTQKTANNKTVQVTEQKTVPMYANTGQFKEVKVSIIADNPHFLIEAKSFAMTADSTKKNINVGTLAALARTFRLKVSVLKCTKSSDNDATAPAQNVVVAVYRPEEFYNDSAALALVPEKKLKPTITPYETIAGVQCARIHRAVAGEVCSPLFLNQEGLHDRYYISVSADKCETLQALLQVKAVNIAKDGLADVHLRVVLNSAGGSLVHGNIKRLNLENLAPSAALSSAQPSNLAGVKLALVPFVSLGDKIEARLNIQTDGSGNFTIDSVPKGAYLLQVAGVALYFNEDMELARWKAQFTVDNKPTVAETTELTTPFQYDSPSSVGQTSALEGGTAFSPGLLVVVNGLAEEEFIQGYVVTPLAVVCGRMTDDLENLTGGIEINDNSPVKAFAMTDAEGRFAINVPPGSGKLTLKRKGFPTKNIDYNVPPPENFFIPPVQVISFDSKSAADKELVGNGGNGKMATLLDKITGRSKINPGDNAKTTLADIFTSGIMRGIAAGSMSKLVNSPSMLPTGVNSKGFTMSGTGYKSTSSPISGITVQGASGVYSTAESNLFGAFTADVFSNGKAAGKTAFGKDAGYENAAWYEAYYNNAFKSSPNLASLAAEETNSDAIAILDIGVQALERGVALAVTVRSNADKKPLLKAKVSVGEKSALSDEKNKQQAAVITGLKPGATSQTTIPVRVEGPVEANFIPAWVDVSLKSNADTTFQTVDLKQGARVSGKIVVKNAKGETLSNLDKNLLSKISIRQQGKDDLIFTSVNPDGTFVLRGVATGGATIVATAQGYIGTKQKVNLKANENTEITLTLTESATKLETIFGFPVEITALQDNGATATVSGAFINIPDNKVFSLPKGTKLAFSNIPLEKQGNTWVPKNNAVLTNTTQLPILAWSSIPLLLKSVSNDGISVSKDGSSNTSGIITGGLTLDYKRFVQQGKGPWEFADIGSLALGNVPTIFNSSDKSPSESLELAIPDATKSVTVYSIVTTFALKGSVLKKSGIHLKGLLTLTGEFAKVFKDNGKDVSFTVKEFHLKPNASIGAVEIGSDEKGIAFNKDLFQFNAKSIDFTVEGLKISGTMGFNLKGLVTAKNIGFQDLIMFTSASNTFSVSAGEFNFNSNNVAIAGFPLGGKNFSFGIVPNTSSTFFLRGGGEIENLPHIKTLGLTLEVRSDETATAIAKTDFERDWAGVAQFRLSGMTLDTEQGILDVDGSIALGLPGVASLSGGGFVFTPKGLDKIKSFGGEIDLRIAKLKIDSLSFGDNLPSPPKLTEPSVKGGGPSFDAWSEPLWLEEPRKGFSAQGIDVTIPGLGLKATANFSYYTMSGGRELNVDLIVGNPNIIPPIPVGPITIQPTGGGFTVNTAAKDLAFRLFSDISILNLEAVVALKPTVMELKVGASAGLQISASALLVLYKQQAGAAKMFFAPVQKKFRVTASAQLSDNQFFDVPAVSAKGTANITLDLDGKEGYMYAGVGLAADVNVLSLITAKANAGIILGYKAPRTAMTPEQAAVLPASYNTFSGVAFALDTKIGKEEHEARTYDIWICDAKVWAYSKAGTKYFMLRDDNSGNYSFGFDMNSGWGGGARCGCAGASIAVGTQLGGGYEGGGRGWYFGGSASGSAELCLYWCVDLDANISVGYQQNPKKVDFDIDVDVF
ncbi:MAG: hypothetical protein H9535_18810 [Ignavibacteria bacterium]|nr:hypothetical protein [Ignavibacteria bacterium]